MAKCDFQVQFDRPERFYQGGETVRGTLTLQVHESVNCRSVKLEAFWKTHGRGNTARDSYHSLNVYEGELSAGRTYEFPFQFPAPTYPWSYQGHYLNVDHYVRIRIDVPWAFDPKYETEFFVGPPAKDSTDLPSSLKAVRNARKSHQTILLILGGIFTVAGIPFIAAFGFGCIFSSVGLLLIFLAVRNVVAEKRLGSVDFSLFPDTVGPGDSVTARLSFTPRSSGKVRRISLKLLGQEIVVSGSGSNRKTHTHNLHQTEAVLGEDLTFRSGERVSLEETFTLPGQPYYSLKLSDNELTWSVATDFDIPFWPNWTQTLTFLMLAPNSTTTQPSQGKPPVLDSPQPIDATPVTATLVPDTPTPQPIMPAPDASWQAADEPTDSSANTAATSHSPNASRESDPRLLALIQQLIKTDRFGEDRDNLINSAQAERFTVWLEVERTSYTYGVLDAPDYASGKTIAGTALGTELRVSIQLPESVNDQVSDLHMGDQIQVEGQAVKWDDLYDRIELRGNLLSHG